MVDISKTYINETLREYGGNHIAEDARTLFINELKEYANELAEQTMFCVKTRKGKKVMKKDIELALKTI